MVRVHHGKKEAFLRFSADSVTPSVYICTKDGRLIAKEYIDSAEEALYWLEKRWRIPVMFAIHSEDEDDDEQVEGYQQIISDEKKVGELTLQEELDWLMFNRKRIVYNSADDQLWAVDCTVNYSQDKTFPVLPSHRPIYTAQWSVPQSPDEHYSAFERDLKKAHPDTEIKLENRLGHFKVARLMGKFKFFPKKVPIVTIEKEATSGIYRIINLLGEEKDIVFFYSDEGSFDNWWRTIRELTEKHLEASWKSLFPKEWDVVAVSKSEFYEHTLAGHFYQTDNFVGMQGVPKGYAVAWENRHDDMLLIRLGSNGTVRCPPELKGKVIGTGGGNIKNIAKKFGRDHWQVKLV